MKKVKIFAVLLLVGFLMATTAEARSSRYSHPRHNSNHHNSGGAAVIGGLVGLGVGIILGSVISQPREVYSPPRDYSSGYYQNLPWLAGARVLIRSNNDLVRAIVEEGLRQRGAIIVIADNYRQPADVVYVAEVQIGQEGYRAFVQIRIIERSSGTLAASGFGTAEFYYDGSDRYRSYQWAASRALINLH